MPHRAISVVANSGSVEALTEDQKDSSEGLGVIVIGSVIENGDDVGVTRGN